MRGTLLAKISRVWCEVIGFSAKRKLFDSFPVPALLLASERTAELFFVCKHWFVIYG
jgi:hypothetical protein